MEQIEKSRARREWVNSETSRIATGKNLNQKQMSKLWTGLWKQAKRRFP